MTHEGPLPRTDENIPGQSSLPGATAPGRRRPGGIFLPAAFWAALLVTTMGCHRIIPVTDAPSDGSQASSPVASLAPGGFVDMEAQLVNPAWVQAQAAKSAYVLIGESHPVACDHQVQARVLELMADAAAPPVVGLEMVSTDMQPVLDLFNKGLLNVDDLESSLGWAKNWGFPFEAYRPIFEIAEKRGLPLFALNVPRDLARKAGKSGLKGLSAQERLELPAVILPSPPAQLEELRQVFKEHPFPKDVRHKAAWKSFLTVQALWDTAMARRAVEARVSQRRPVVILAGGGHVEHGWGIASRLAVLDPKGERLSIMPWRGGEAPGKDDADLYFFCPVPNRPRLGVTLETRDAKLVVKTVASGSRAETAGIKPGDVLAKAQDKPVGVVSDLHDAAIRALEEDGVLRLEILRDGQVLEIPVPMGKTPATP